MLFASPGDHVTSVGAENELVCIIQSVPTHRDSNVPEKSCRKVSWFRIANSVNIKACRGSVNQKSILISSQGGETDLQQQRNLFLKTKGEIVIALKPIATLPSASLKQYLI